MTDYSTYTDQQLEEEQVALNVEIGNRAIRNRAPAAMEALNRDYLKAAGVAQGEEWRAPTGAHDAYPEGWVTRRGGKVWESLIPGNVWAPGESGWREKVEAGAAPASWVQPTGAHDAYSAGAEVTHSGQTWISDLDGNTWIPGEYGWTAKTSA